jgi:hypothetical protein
MKLSKAKKQRIEEYLDMLEFNGDIISRYTTVEKANIIIRLIALKTSSHYLLSDKPMLNLLERRYPKHKINWS